MELLISQSLMNTVLSVPCPHKIYLRYIEKVPVESSEVMKRGHYFEWCVLGDSSSEAPHLEKLKSGAKSQAEKDIDELAGIAKKMLVHLGINVKDALTQVRIEGNGLSGVLDMVTNDIQDPTRKAIYDLKYTETKYDDRFNGWADIESKVNAKRQAKHYIHLWHQMHGEYLPYYFLVFGKSGWSRIIKCVLTQDSLDVHLSEIQVVRDMLHTWEKSDWKGVADYELCKDCDYRAVCRYFNPLPVIEKIDV